MGVDKRLQVLMPCRKVPAEALQQGQAGGRVADLAVRYHLLTCPRPVQSQGGKAAAQEAYGRDIDDQEIRLREVAAYQLGVIEGAMFRNSLGNATYEGHRGIAWRGDCKQGSNRTGTHSFHIGKIAQDGLLANLARGRPLPQEMTSLHHQISGRHGAGIRRRTGQYRGIVSIEPTGGHGGNFPDGGAFSHICESLS